MPDKIEERIIEVFEELDELAQDVANNDFKVTEEISSKSSGIFILSRNLRKNILKNRRNKNAR